MKMVNRHRVDGTNITIGKRVSLKEGREVVSKVYTAEYRAESGKQKTVGLKTRNLTEAKRKAVELHTQLQYDLPTSLKRKEDVSSSECYEALTIQQIIDQYMLMIKARGVTSKTEAKYRVDLEKLSTYCQDNKITQTHQFSRDAFYGYRQWLIDNNYADKTIYGALIMCKQVFKWAYHESKVKEYVIGTIKVPKARAKPQACFTSDQVEKILEATKGIEHAAFATLAFAGLRVGELMQLQWNDVMLDRGELGMFHIKRGGSNGTTKNKDHRFIPIHPRIKPLLKALPEDSKLVFPTIKDRALLKRLKALCRELGFNNPQQFKVHTFRHYFASLCANHHVAYRKALVWLGHSSSQILDLYYHLNDADSQSAMQALAKDTFKQHTR